LAPLKSITSDAFPASFSDKIRKIGDVTLKNRILTSVGAVLLDGPAPLRRFMIRNFIMDSTELDTVLREDDALEAFIRRSAVGVWHASCSCRMGAENDPMAVTDPSGRVRAVQGLRVVDASIFPAIPCANTNFPTMMLAEKIADDMLQGA
jgi:5-(hydroxymethyl)furfural/furfural oxidase